MNKKILTIALLAAFSIILTGCNSNDGESVISNLTAPVDSTTGIVTTGSSSSSTTTTTTTTAPKIEGALKDGNGNPVIGANITLVGGTPERSYVTQSTDTTATNNFTIENLAKGTYTLDISKTGYVPYSTSLSVDSNDISLNLKLYFKLSEDHGVISCYYGGTGTPASAVLTRYLTQDSVVVNSSPVLQTVDLTNSANYNNGYFKFENIAPTIEYTKTVGTVTYKMNTYYQVQMSFSNITAITTLSILVNAGETTLVEVFPSSSTESTIPELQSPSTGAKVYSAVPVFSWKPINGAEAYEIVVKQDMGYTAGAAFNTGSVLATDPIIWQCHVNSGTSVLYAQTNPDAPMAWATVGLNRDNDSNTFTDGLIDCLENGKRYYWMVRAYNAVDTWEFNSFTGTNPNPFAFIKEHLPAPTPVMPADNQLLDITVSTPLFSWNSVPGTGRYLFQVGINNPATTIYWQVATTEVMVRYPGAGVTGFAGGNTYSWRVSGTDKYNNPLSWSAWQAFRF